MILYFLKYCFQVQYLDFLHFKLFTGSGNVTVVSFYTKELVQHSFSIIKNVLIDQSLLPFIQSHVH